VKLNQALAIVNGRNSAGKLKNHFLVCGFEPLHLVPLFQAHLLERLPDSNAQVQTGVYGDLLGNVELAISSSATAAALAMEWSDIDPRLGLRSAGGWSNESIADIPVNALQSFSHLEVSISKLAARMPIAVAAPSLPLPPIGNTISDQVALIELELEQQLALFLLRIARIPGVRILQRWRIGFPTPPASRLDARMELFAGFPYTVPFADGLAAAFAQVLYQPAPRKGLITDLDDTLWAGLVGEVGVQGVSWQQECHTQAHGLYQQMLGHLAANGIFVGVASKNETSTVVAALARNDLFLNAESLFPVVANWGPKSASVATILATWNISADAVVFIDDNPMELDEVKRKFPEITCLKFESKNPAKVLALLDELRDLFGKPLLQEEDFLRLPSLRASASLREEAKSGVSVEFLKDLGGTVSFDWNTAASDKRPLELINKTNQFNLNGLRLGEGEWLQLLEDRDRILTVVSYRDRFGPLGKVAVLIAARCGSKIRVLHWVLSCRAFSRMLEHHTLHALFDISGAEEIEFTFQATERNQPLQAFFESAGILPDPAGAHRISRVSFLSRNSSLPHKVSGNPEGKSTN
jgi:FkbH-like protein